MILRLAYGGPPKAIAKGLPRDAEYKPALLVAYPYLKQFEANRRHLGFRDWALDSGAFSAHNSGTTIDLDKYTAKCKELLHSDTHLCEVFALDVIGDPLASLRNCDWMWERGVPAIPCFHYGSPWRYLEDMAQRFPKIALGGVAARSTARKLVWAKECFGRVWPKRVHGFAFASEKCLMALPWHSVDASSWEQGPCAFGNWKAFGAMSVRGSEHNLRSEVDWYMRLERKATARWAVQAKALE